MNKFNNELKEFYNFSKPFFKGKHENNYGEFLSNKELNDVLCLLIYMSNNLIHRFYIIIKKPHSNNIIYKINKKIIKVS